MIVKEYNFKLGFPRLVGLFRVTRSNFSHGNQNSSRIFRRIFSGLYQLMDYLRLHTCWEDDHTLPFIYFFDSLQPLCVKASVQ